MSAQHTPGPWRAGNAGGSVVGDARIDEVPGSEHIEYYGGHLVAESIAQRNVPLIAAAPDLLEALKTTAKAFEMAIRSNLSRDLYDSEEEYTAAVRSNVALTDALKAIAKAEGRS